MIGIYKITSPSGRIYIGQSMDIERRWSTYHNNDCKTQIKLNRSFKKYGVEAHTFEIIEECEIEQLNTRERYWQDFYKCMEKGLNCLLTKTDEKPKVLSKETRLKMSNSSLGKMISEETKLKMSLARKGKKMSEESKLKISLFHSGKIKSDETKLKMSLSKLGKKRSEESCMKMSENRKKKVIDTLANKIYSSVKEASEAINIKYATLASMLNGQRTNKTSCCYL
jgi:group I intron endonuclease